MYSGDECYGDEITSPLDERNDVDEGNVWPDEELDEELEEELDEEEAPPAPAEPMHKARRRWAETSRRYGMDPWLFS